MNKEELLSVIDAIGFIWVDKLCINSYKFINELQEEGIITSLKELNIDFMNNSYCYTRSDNRYNCKIIENGNYSWVEAEVNSLREVV